MPKPDSEGVRGRGSEKIGELGPDSVGLSSEIIGSSLLMRLGGEVLSVLRLKERRRSGSEMELGPG